MSSSVVSSSLFPTASLVQSVPVPCHAKSPSDVIDQRITDIEATVRQCLSAPLSGDEDRTSSSIDESPSSEPKATKSPAAVVADQPMDLTTPSTGAVLTTKKVDVGMSSLASSPLSASSIDEPVPTTMADDVLRRQKQKAMVDAVLFNHANPSPSPQQELTPILSMIGNKRNQYSDTEENGNGKDDEASAIAAAIINATVRSSTNKRKSEHPIKLDYQQSFEPTAAKVARADPDAVLIDEPVDARQFLRVATSSLKEHLSTATTRFVDDVMSQIEAYFCVTPNNAPPGSKLSKGCQTEIPLFSSLCQTSQAQQQLQSLASTYSDLLASTNAASANQASALLGAAGNGHANNFGSSRNAPSPPSLLSSMAQFGGISTLYSPVSPPQHQQAAAVAAAFAASANSNRVNGNANALSATMGSMSAAAAAAAAGLLPSPVPGGFGGSAASYHGVYNPYLANVFQSAAQALFQQQQHSQQQQQQQKQFSNATAAAALFGASQSLASLGQSSAVGSNAKKFSATSLLGQTSSTTALTQSSSSRAVASPTPSSFAQQVANNPASSSSVTGASALDFSSVANYMAVAAAKRKRTKVTDTRLSARTARKLLDNSFQGGLAGAPDGDINVDASTPEKQQARSIEGADSRSLRPCYGDGSARDDEDMKAGSNICDEDLENDERLLGNEDMGCTDQDDADIAAENLNRGGDESPVLNTGGAPSSTSSRVSVGAGDAEGDDIGENSRSAGNNLVPSLLLPFTPNRSHQHHHHSSTHHQQQQQQQQQLCNSQAIDASFLAEHSAALQQNGLGLAGTAFPIGKTATLTSMHLRKAKLMFFYVRYPSSSVLKIYFPDVSFNKNNTAQLVKWFSNFREFYYINIEKYARQLVAEGVTNCDEVDVSRNSELFKVLNLHYNRNNQLQVPSGFSVAVRTTVREFMRAILLQKDQDPSWKKQIYKVIARLDEPLPPFFRSMEWMHQLLAD